eukprot:TRINITY_DN21934_c0_g1_i1.p1 TRINITY_DN21934_c0_g1~~TRINITY_DN21934_c0_g1_i1.p1  ORF type:complete len:1106 (+),score=180.36 TRINITY_DN21934_c0_g1_i1:129-3446(+)
MLPASCNWNSSSIADVTSEGILGYGARSSVHFCTVNESGVSSLPAIVQCTDKVCCLCFINQGKGIAVGTEDRHISLYDVKTLPVENSAESAIKPAHTIQHRERVRAMAYDSVSDTLAFCDYAGATHTVAMAKSLVGCAVKSSLLVTPKSISDQCGIATCVTTYHHNNKLIIITGHAKGSITLSVTTSMESYTVKFTEHRDSVTSICIIPSSSNHITVITSSSDRQILRWNLSVPNDIRDSSDIADCLQKRSVINTLKTRSQGSIQPIRHVATAHWQSREGTNCVLVSYMNVGQIRACVLGGSDKVEQVDWQPALNAKRQVTFWWIGVVKNTVVAMGTDHTIRSFPISTAPSTDTNQVKINTGHASSLSTMCGPAFCLSATASGIWAAGTAYKAIKVSSFPNDLIVRERVTSIHIHHPLVFIGLANGVIGCFRLDQGQKPQLVHSHISHAHKGAVYVLAFVAETDEVLSVGADQRLLSHQLTFTGGKRMSLSKTRPRLNNVTSVGAWNGGEGQREIVVGFKDGTVGTIDDPNKLKVANGKINRISILKRQSKPSTLTALCAESGSIIITDLSCSTLLCSSELHKATVIDVNWSPDVAQNPNLLSASYDSSVQLWSYQEQEQHLLPIRSFRSHLSRVFSVVFLSSKLALSCGDDHTIRQHILTPDYGGCPNTSPPEVVVSNTKPSSRQREKRTATHSGDLLEDIQASAAKWNARLVQEGYANEIKRHKATVSVPDELRAARSAGATEASSLLYCLQKLTSREQTSPTTPLQTILKKIPDKDHKPSPFHVVSSLLTANNTSGTECGRLQSMGLAFSPIFGSHVQDQLLSTTAISRSGMDVYSSVCQLAAGDIQGAVRTLLQSGMVAEAALVTHSHKAHLQPDDHRSLLESIFAAYKPQSAVSSVLSSIAGGDVTAAVTLVQNLALSPDNLLLFEIGCILAEHLCSKDPSNPKRVSLLNQMRDQYAIVYGTGKGSGGMVPVFHGFGSTDIHPVILLHLLESPTVEFSTPEKAYRAGEYIWSLPNRSGFFDAFLARKAAACAHCWSLSKSDKLASRASLLLRLCLQSTDTKDLNMTVVDPLITLSNDDLTDKTIDATKKEISNMLSETCT